LLRWFRFVVLAHQQSGGVKAGKESKQKNYKPTKNGNNGTIVRALFKQGAI
jgi:hypothetical protein